MKNKSIPIKYMLQIPIIKLDIKDQDGNEIKDITCINYYNGALMIGTAHGLFTDKPELFNNTNMGKIL